MGWILGAAGYVERRTPGDQSDEALLAIKLVMGLAIVVLISIALFASFRYKINNRKLSRVRYFIEARKAGTVLTEEEEAERTALVHELYGKTDPGGYPAGTADGEGGADVDGEHEQGDVPEAAFEAVEGEPEKTDAE